MTGVQTCALPILLADTINSSMDLIESALNILDAIVLTTGLQIPQLSAADVATTGATASDGYLVYDTDNNVYVGKQSGALVKFTTSAYP